MYDGWLQFFLPTLCQMTGTLLDRNAAYNVAQKTNDYTKCRIVVSYIHCVCAMLHNGSFNEFPYHFRPVYTRTYVYIYIQ